MVFCLCHHTIVIFEEEHFNKEHAVRWYQIIKKEKFQFLCKWICLHKCPRNKRISIWRQTLFSVIDLHTEMQVNFSGSYFYLGSGSSSACLKAYKPLESSRKERNKFSIFWDSSLTSTRAMQLLWFQKWRTWSGRVFWLLSGIKDTTPFTESGPWRILYV